MNADPTPVPMDTPQCIQSPSPDTSTRKPSVSSNGSSSTSEYTPKALYNAIHCPNRDPSRPMNATEASLLPLIDAEFRIDTLQNVVKFIDALESAKQEPEQALILVVLRATTTSSSSKVAKACTRAFEQRGGLKLAKVWLDHAVEWSYTDLILLLLSVLKSLPLRLTSITEAKINEPIVQLRKTAKNERVKRSAQELLKFWRSKFTEKEKKSKVEAAKSAATGAASPRQGESSPKDTPKKKSSNKSAKSSDLLGNLMQRRTSKSSKTSSSSGKEKAKTSEAEGTTEQSTTAKPAIEEPAPVQLPTIESFNAAVNKTSKSTSSKKIRWADDNGKELVQVRLIESWRDLVNESQMDESFRDAKLREHADERNAIKSHKERERFSLKEVHEWSEPAIMKLPSELEERRGPIKTAEVDAQDQRTRREMEFLVLDGEVPPDNPKEWKPKSYPPQDPPVEIPLFDPASTTDNLPAETAEERALRDALGPLQQSTLAALMDNEQVLPQVYSEAERNGNYIPDSRVLEIVDQHRRQQQPMYPQYPPPPHAFHGPPGGFPPRQPPHPQGYGFVNGPPHGYTVPGGPPPPPRAFNPPAKRKAQPGLFPDGPPAKRTQHRGAAPCMFFNTPHGCKHGNACQYAHEVGNEYNSRGPMPFNGPFPTPMNQFDGRGRGPGPSMRGRR